MTVDPSATETKPVDGNVSQDANNPATSSPADDKPTGDTKPTSVFDAVNAQLAKDGLAGESPAPKEGSDSDPESPKGDATGEGDKPELVEGKDAEVPAEFHKHPAWKRIITERDEVKGEIEAMRPRAERFDQMQSMMRESDLSSEEVTTGFNIMALMKSDPHKALETLKPFYESLLQVTGEVLPAAIQERVESGAITEEDARDLARARAAAAAADRRVVAERQRSEQTSAQTVVADMQSGAAEWETAWRGKDPDYDKKLPFVEDRIKALRADKPPRNRADALRLCDEALADVNKRFAPLAVRKPEIKPTPSGSSASTSHAPRNSLEAARAALSAMSA